MRSVVLGFTLAMFSMVFFGLYMVPRKFCGLKSLEFVLSMGFGVLLTVLFAWVAEHGTHRLAVPGEALAFAFLCGPVWTLGMMAFTLAVAESGLTLATPIKNTTAVMGALVGLLFFNEAKDTVAWMAVLGSLLIVLCAVVIGQAGDAKGSRYVASAKGTAYSLTAAFFFAAYTFPLKTAMGLGLDSTSIVLVMATGILVTAAVGQSVRGAGLGRWRRQPLSDHFYGALAGSIWALATLLMNASIERIGLAVTWPITNLNTLVTVLIGAMVFREVPFNKQWPKLAQGMIFACLGVLLLGLAKR